MLFKDTVDRSTLNLLTDLNANSRLNGFFLAGGTALALQIGHRVSLDLDFFSLQVFTPDEIKEILVEYGELEIVNASKNTFLSFIKEIKVDFLRHDYPLIKDVKNIEGLRLASLPDIAAMKLNAINNRGAKKDFYDLYFLMREFTIYEIVEFFEIKYPSFNQLQLFKSLLYFEDANLQPDPVLVNTNLTWAEVKKKVTQEVSRLF